MEMWRERFYKRWSLSGVVSHQSAPLILHTKPSPDKYTFFPLHLSLTVELRCTSGGVYIPCIYLHARRVTVGDWGLVAMSACDILWVLINSLCLSILLYCCFEKGADSKTHNTHYLVLFCSTTHLRVRREVPRFDTPSTNLNQVNVLHAGHHIIVMCHHASCLPWHQLAILGVCLFNKKQPGLQPTNTYSFAQISNSTYDTHHYTP